MEKDLIDFLVRNLGYAKLLKLIAENLATFGVELHWHTTAKKES